MHIARCPCVVNEDLPCTGLYPRIPEHNTFCVVMECLCSFCISGIILVKKILVRFSSDFKGTCSIVKFPTGRLVAIT